MQIVSYLNQNFEQSIYTCNLNKITIVSNLKIMQLSLQLALVELSKLFYDFLQIYAKVVK